jgi:hypothetical protein
LGKYLVAVASHSASEQNETGGSKLSFRQRLHILYLVNDLLHHGKYHTSEPGLQFALTRPLRPFLIDLFRHAASGAKVRMSTRVSDLVSLWKQEGYFEPEFVAQLKDASMGFVHEVEPAAQAPRADSQVKEMPYLLPSTHGDPSLPYYDLPAGNLMRHIVPNSSRPMRVSEIQALQLSSGPADESLVTALKDFLQDVDGMENSLTKLETAGLFPEVDELGQISYHDEAGDLVGNTYYGWSMAFCDKMKKRGHRDSNRSPRRSRSRSSDRSRDDSRRKHRRLSNTSRSRSDTSGSRSRSPSRPRYADRGKKFSPSRSRSRSRSRSPSPRYSPKLEQHHRSELPKTDISTNAAPLLHPLPPPPVPPAAIGMGMHYPPPPFPHAGMPIPPPRPPHWSGPWPPPPPSVPPGDAAYPNVSLPPPPPNWPYPPPRWPGLPNASPGHNNQHTGRP